MNNTISAAPTPEQQRYAEAMDSALWIIHYYEGDPYEFLMDESVIDDLAENHGYSISDAHAMLSTASAIHEYRTLSGFYN